MLDGKERRHVAFEDQMLEESLSPVREGPGEKITLRDSWSARGHERLHADREHVVVLERARREVLDEKVDVTEARRLSRASGLVRHGGDESQMRRSDVREL